MFSDGGREGDSQVRAYHEGNGQVIEIGKRFVEDLREVGPPVDCHIEFQGMNPVAAKLACVSYAVQSGIDHFFPFFHGQVCVDLGWIPRSHFESPDHLPGEQAIYPAPELGGG